VLALTPGLLFVIVAPQAQTGSDICA
jgi:hypothetical protein